MLPATQLCPAKLPNADNCRGFIHGAVHALQRGTRSASVSPTKTTRGQENPQEGDDGRMAAPMPLPQDDAPQPAGELTCAFARAASGLAVILHLCRLIPMQVIQNLTWAADPRCKLDRPCPDFKHHVARLDMGKVLMQRVCPATRQQRPTQPLLAGRPSLCRRLPFRNLLHCNRYGLGICAESHGCLFWWRVVHMLMS